MLNVDASKRPSIADLLEHKSIKPRIATLMSAEEVKVEFDHTVLHNDNILKSDSKPVSSRPASAAGGYQARPYSARSGVSERSKVEEAKVPPSRAPVGISSGSDKRLPKPDDKSSKNPSRFVGGSSAKKDSAGI